ncbi:MAG: hypothetical protein SPG09_06595, partial [Lachnospiraceae bacterium]|nr:hypothetical protein [bacterium]MDY5517261.1 hypothetical protein [Lachnospiraceae bacterium]
QKPLPPLPPKPVAQKPLPPLPPKPVAQKPLPPLPSKPVAQKLLPPLPPAPKKPLPSIPQEEQPKPVVQEQQGEQAEPVVQESEQTQSAEPVTQETQQTEENQQQQETNTTETAQQQEEPPQQQPQTPEPTGSSMRKEFLDMMKAAVETGGRLINPGYKAIIARFEQLNTLLGETITETNQKDSWKKLQEAYGWLAAESGQYAKTHAAASTPLGRECRRHARMLLFLCKADMNTLRIAIRDKELAKKNTTWRQILEQPAASATQQTQTQQTETQQAETQQAETQQTETQQTETQQTETQQQTTTQDAVQTNQPKGNPARDFRNLEQQLSGSAKGGIGWNSKYYNRVKAALEQTAKAMEQGFSRDSKDNMRKLSEASAALQALQAACQEYTARNPGTQSGKNRKKIVLQIQTYAAQDALGCQKAISDFIGMEPEEQAKQTWMSVIQKARSVQITVGNFENLPSPKKGQVSDVSIIESGEGAQKAYQYFKKEDSLDVSIGARMKGKIHDGKLPFYMAIQATLKEYPDLSEEDIEQLELDLGNYSTRPKLSKEGEKAEKFYYDYLEKHRTNIEQIILTNGILEEGGNANMSRRNVATSRMAHLLGLEHLVAESRTVDILDKATGQTVRGNLMDQAEGVEIENVEQSLKDKKVSSGFIHDAMNLQVLDMLCGQVDRHGNNILYKADKEGIVYGIQGIDNDASFGTNEDAVSGETWGRKDAKVFDKDTGEMTIPYMDRQLADRIMALDPEMVRYVLRDLLKEAEIDAAVKRLKVMQDHIPKALEKHKERFLEKEDDWKKDTIGEELLASFQSERKLAQYSKNKFEDILKIHPEITEVLGIDSEMQDALKQWDSDRSGFYKTYKDEAEKKAEKVKNLIEKITIYLMNKHGGNRNYYGRFVLPPDLGE